MNALKLLMQDHRTVEALFKRFEGAGEDAAKLKKQLSEQIIRELAIHSAIEEQLLYPAARLADEELKDTVLEALEEHHLAKISLAEIQHLEPSDERFEAKVTVLMESVRHHIEEEENELFPALRKLMGEDQLEALGAALDQAKELVPTRPHPLAPDTPPGNLIAGSLAKIFDTGRDAVRGIRTRATQVAAKTVRARVSRKKSSPKRR